MILKWEIFAVASGIRTESWSLKLNLYIQVAYIGLEVFWVLCQFSMAII